ncbi:MAG: M28 family peptidase [Chloroflexota bacterium]|nr:M28 family peptidase [Chloroflexota bacterium]
MKHLVSLSLALLLVILSIECSPREKRFDGRRALKDVKTLCNLGPRPVGSKAHQQASRYIAETLEQNGWDVEVQEFAYQGETLRNVIGKRGEGPLILLGTHFDTRPLADKDPADRSQPVMGANDGGSGTAVVLELARALDTPATDHVELWLAFFDGQDRGDIGGWPWSVGARHTARNLDRKPEYVLIIDMVGDDDQRIYYEWSSALWLQEKVWEIAAELGYQDHFIPQHQHHVIHDHTPFLTAGIPAAIMIDLDYPYWHTGHDTVDKISVDSLQRVGDVLETLLEGEPLRSSFETHGAEE